MRWFSRLEKEWDKILISRGVASKEDLERHRHVFPAIYSAYHPERRLAARSAFYAGRIPDGILVYGERKGQVDYVAAILSIPGIRVQSIQLVDKTSGGTLMVRYKRIRKHRFRKGTAFDQFPRERRKLAYLQRAALRRILRSRQNFQEGGDFLRSPRLYAGKVLLTSDSFPRSLKQYRVEGPCHFGYSRYLIPLKVVLENIREIAFECAYDYGTPRSTQKPKDKKRAKPKVKSVAAAPLEGFSVKVYG